ncbi:hypothetical protein [Vibrio breoganii]|uniref:hypothetical protein n=1 Tax=Vibrio breoganii TaxID=553239 RepID=UPI00038153AE|nr:hypothetical protein [Vibrio breoganii]OED94254.1 hypothetical protein A1QG_05790 [Vibrio breoganii ZF-29]
MGIILWVILSIVVGFIASGRGRSGFGYFFLSLIITPLLTLVILLVIGTNEKKIEEDQLSSGTFKKCSDCAELVKIEAKVCKHCGATFTTKGDFQIFVKHDKIKAIDMNDFVSTDDVNDLLIKGYESRGFVHANSLDDAEKQFSLNNI